MLGLRLCARALSSRGKRGPLFIAVRGPLIIVASPAAEHRLQTRRLSSCGSRAQLLRGMWDPPRPGFEPASPAPAGRLSTTAPPGKPHHFSILNGDSLVLPSQSKLSCAISLVYPQLPCLYLLAYLPDPHLPCSLKVSLPSQMPAVSPGGGGWPRRQKGKELQSNPEGPRSFDAERAVPSEGGNKEPRWETDSGTKETRRQNGRAIWKARSKGGFSNGSGLKRLCEDGGRLSRLRALSPDPDGIWKS